MIKFVVRNGNEPVTCQWSRKFDGEAGDGLVTPSASQVTVLHDKPWPGTHRGKDKERRSTAKPMAPRSGNRRHGNGIQLGTIAKDWLTNGISAGAITLMACAPERAMALVDWLINWLTAQVGNDAEKNLKWGGSLWRELLFLFVKLFFDFLLFIFLIDRGRRAGKRWVVAVAVAFIGSRPARVKQLIRSGLGTDASEARRIRRNQETALREGVHNKRDCLQWRQVSPPTDVQNALRAHGFQLYVALWRSIKVQLHIRITDGQTRGRRWQ